MTCVWSEMLFLYILYVIYKYFLRQSDIQQEKLTEIIFSGDTRRDAWRAHDVHSI